MSLTEINKLGDRIAESKGQVSGEDLEALQAYRQTFKEPISRVFNFVLTAARKIDRQSIVTYRIKRIDTIVEKLRRFKDNEHGGMNLSRMGDIAGCRCIMSVPDEKKLYQLRDVVLAEYGAHCRINDYLETPRSSGYKSLHIYVKDPLTQKTVEIQIRNRHHHNWATLVEIVDILFGTKQKERGAAGKLGRFLFLYSNVKHLSKEEFSEMMDLERKMRVFKKMSDLLTKNYLNIRRQWVEQNNRGHYFVITASKSGSEILSFASFKEAESVYYEKYRANRESNIVLTCLKSPDFEQITMAYSNYILAMHEFFNDYREAVANRIIECVNENHFFDFFTDFNHYCYNLSIYIKNLKMEIDSLRDCVGHMDSVSITHTRKWLNDMMHRLKRWGLNTESFIKRLQASCEGSSMKSLLVIMQTRRLQKLTSEILQY